MSTRPRAAVLLLVTPDALVPCPHLAWVPLVPPGLAVLPPTSALHSQECAAQGPKLTVQSQFSGRPWHFQAARPPRPDVSILLIKKGLATFSTVFLTSRYQRAHAAFTNNPFESCSPCGWQDLLLANCASSVRQSVRSDGGAISQRAPSGTTLGVRQAPPGRSSRHLFRRLQVEASAPFQARGPVLLATVPGS